MCQCICGVPVYVFIKGCMCSGDLGLVHILTLQCAQFCSCWGMAVAILARTVCEVVSSLLAFVWQLSTMAAELCDMDCGSWSVW